MRYRYEQFGGVLKLDKPEVTLFVNRSYMRKLGFGDSPLWEGAEDYSLLSAPLSVHFAVTDKCPFSCPICYKDKYDEPKHIAVTQARKIIDLLAQMNVFTIAFGGGEPFAHPDIFYLAEYAREKGIEPNITTNGYFINQSTVKKCTVFGHIHVSLDFPDTEYDLYKSKGAFRAANNALDLLSQEGIEVGINTVVSRANYNRLEELVKFIKSKGIGHVAFLRLKPGVGAEKYYNTLKLTYEQSIQFPKLVTKLTRKYKINIQLDCSFTPIFLNQNPSLRMIKKLGVLGCEGGNSFIEITRDGFLKSCSFGTSSKNTALDLNTKWKTDPLFNKYRDVTAHIKNPCKSCKYLEVCRGGCHAISKFVTGDFNNPDPECPKVVKYYQKRRNAKEKN